VHPTKGRGKWVIVALETPKASADNVPITLIEVWDVEKSMLVETFVMKTASTSTEASAEEPQEAVRIDAEPDPAAAIAALRSRQGAYPVKLSKRAQSSSSSIPQDDILLTPSPTIRAVVVGAEFGGHQSVHRSEISDLSSEHNTHSRSLGRGFMITGSEDRRIRLWDIARLERTSVLNGTESEHDKPSYRFGLTAVIEENNSPKPFLCSTIRSNTGAASANIETWPDSTTLASNANRPPQRMSLITHNQQNLLKSHQDIITSLACIDSPFRGGIISGDRAGVIKVWRIDGADH
jgi:phosphoinositide-3-kinase regulatory subunit 4